MDYRGAFLVRFTGTQISLSPRALRDPGTGRWITSGRGWKWGVGGWG